MLWVPPDLENQGVVNLPSVFLRSIEFQKSAPGNTQQEVLEELILVILPLVRARSYEISSSASSSPCTRVSRDCIPFCELPMNLWKVRKTNRRFIMMPSSKCTTCTTVKERKIHSTQKLSHFIGKSNMMDKEIKIDG